MTRRSRPTRHGRGRPPAAARPAPRAPTAPRLPGTPRRGPRSPAQRRLVFFGAAGGWNSQVSGFPLSERCPRESPLSVKYVALEAPVRTSMASRAVNVSTLPELNTLPTSPVTGETFPSTQTLSQARAPEPLTATTRFTPLNAMVTLRVWVVDRWSFEVAVIATVQFPVDSSSGVLKEPSSPTCTVTGPTVRPAGGALGEGAGLALAAGLPLAPGFALEAGCAPRSPGAGPR